MAELNSWGVSYSTIAFLETALSGHRKVRAFHRERDIVFVIECLDHLSTIRALLVSEYTLGLAAVLRAEAEFGKLDCIVTGANWNGYTREAKEYGTQNGIGIFVIGEFLGALNLRRPHEYVRRDENGKPVYRYRGA